MTGKHRVRRYGEGYRIVQPDGTSLTRGDGTIAVFSKRKALAFAAELDRQQCHEEPAPDK